LQSQNDIASEGLSDRSTILHIEEQVMQLVSVTELINGERVGPSAVEITTVPHLSILKKRYPTTANIDTEYKYEMARLLSEVFQNYKTASDGFQDIALEIQSDKSDKRGRYDFVNFITKSYRPGPLKESAHCIITSFLQLGFENSSFRRGNLSGLVPSHTVTNKTEDVPV